MEPPQLKLIFQTLDDIRHIDEGGEYWLARELYPLLGYSKWENFLGVVEKARQASTNAGGATEEHFLLKEKIVETGSGATRVIEDVRLTRYAAYLAAVNGDPRKQEIAVAQTYFVTQTRKIEVMQKRMEEIERLSAREKLKITEKEFGNLVFARGVDGPGIALIRSRGDEELFGKKNTETMKKQLGVVSGKPLADVLPTVTLKAKDLATAMTTENTRRKNLYGRNSIGQEHVDNSKSVRGALVNSGIFPENLPPAENIKIIEIRHSRELKELQQKHQRELNQATQNLDAPKE